MYGDDAPTSCATWPGLRGAFLILLLVSFREPHAADCPSQTVSKTCVASGLLRHSQEGSVLSWPASCSLLPGCRRAHPDLHNEVASLPPSIHLHSCSWSSVVVPASHTCFPLQILHALQNLAQAHRASGGTFRGCGASLWGAGGWSHVRGRVLVTLDNYQ